MSDQVRQAEMRRLEMLELQTARQGIETPPAVLNEALDLRRKWGLPEITSNPGLERSAATIERRLELVLSEVRIAVTAGIHIANRTTRLEEQFARDREERTARQQFHDAKWEKLDERLDRRGEDQDDQWDDFQAALNRTWNAVLILALLFLFAATIGGLLLLRPA